MEVIKLYENLLEMVAANPRKTGPKSALARLYK
jgi:hypothetical protein